MGGLHVAKNASRINCLRPDGARRGYQAGSAGLAGGSAAHRFRSLAVKQRAAIRSCFTLNLGDDV